MIVITYWYTVIVLLEYWPTHWSKTRIRPVICCLTLLESIRKNEIATQILQKNSSLLIVTMLGKAYR